MRDVLMIALLVASVVVLAAYVACCDRIIGRDHTDADERGNPGPSREMDRAA